MLTPTCHAAVGAGAPAGWVSHPVRRVSRVSTWVASGPVTVGVAAPAGTTGTTRPVATRAAPVTRTWRSLGKVLLEVLGELGVLGSPPVAEVLLLRTGSSRPPLPLALGRGEPRDVQVQELHVRDERVLLVEQRLHLGRHLLLLRGARLGLGREEDGLGEEAVVVDG